MRHRSYRIPALVMCAAFLALLALWRPARTLAQNTIVLLNTQYHAESTGNVLTVPFTFFKKASTCDGSFGSYGAE
jgi:hypothetical protein